MILTLLLAASAAEPELSEPVRAWAAALAAEIRPCARTAPPVEAPVLLVRLAADQPTRVGVFGLAFSHFEGCVRANAQRLPPPAMDSERDLRLSFALEGGGYRLVGIEPIVRLPQKEAERAALDAAQDGLVACLGARSRPALLRVDSFGRPTRVWAEKLTDEERACADKLLGGLQLPFDTPAILRVPLDPSLLTVPAPEKPAPTGEAGGLSKDVIGKVIRSHWQQIKRCYEVGLNKNPNLQGKMTLTFRIAADGSVREVFPVDSFEPDLTLCAASAVFGWVFPPPSGGGEVVVTYPWVFRQAKPGE